jgi:hypothetical protein
VPVGPLDGPLEAKSALVVRGWPSRRCDAMVGRPVANIKALASRIGMVSTVRAVGDHAADEIAEPDDLRLATAITLDDNASLPLNLADAGNDDQLCESIAGLMLPS